MCTQSFPEIANVLIRHVLKNVNEFGRLFRYESQLHVAQKIFPQYAIFNKTNVVEASAALRKSHEEIVKATIALAQIRRQKTSTNGCYKLLQCHAITIAALTASPEAYDLGTAQEIASDTYNKVPKRF